MAESDERFISFTIAEAISIFLIMKAREDSLKSDARCVLGKLEKFLYAALSIEEMERLIRESSR